jgi:hypothetical protein
MRYVPGAKQNVAVDAPDSRADAIRVRDIDGLIHVPAQPASATALVLGESVMA